MLVCCRRYESLVKPVVMLLARLIKKDVPADYHYYGIPSPWLQARFITGKLL